MEQDLWSTLYDKLLPIFDEIHKDKELNGVTYKQIIDKAIDVIETLKTDDLVYTDD